MPSVSRPAIFSLTEAQVTRLSRLGVQVTLYASASATALMFAGGLWFSLNRGYASKSFDTSDKTLLGGGVTFCSILAVIFAAAAFVAVYRRRRLFMSFETQRRKTAEENHGTVEMAPLGETAWPADDPLQPPPDDDSSGLDRE